MYLIEIILYWWQNQLTGLDIGCGLGRLFYEFVNRGWHVWGYEPDEDYYNMSVAVCRSKIHLFTKKFWDSLL